MRYILHDGPYLTRTRIDGAIEVAPDALIQGVGPLLERPLVSQDTAIETLRHRLDPTPDTHVADAQFPQTVVHVLKKDIEQGLGQIGRFIPVLLQPVHDEEDMQNQEVEAPIDRIRQPAGKKEPRLAGLFHDAGIKVTGRLFVKSGSKKPSHDRETPCSDDKISPCCYSEPPSGTDGEIDGEIDDGA